MQSGSLRGSFSSQSAYIQTLATLSASSRTTEKRSGLSESSTKVKNFPAALVCSFGFSLIPFSHFFSYLYIAFSSLFLYVSFFPSFVSVTGSVAMETTSVGGRRCSANQYLRRFKPSSMCCFSFFLSTRLCSSLCRGQAFLFSTIVRFSISACARTKDHFRGTEKQKTKCERNDLFSMLVKPKRSRCLLKR